MPNVFDNLNAGAEAERAAREVVIRENAASQPSQQQSVSGPPPVYSAWNPNPKNPAGTIYPTSGGALLRNKAQIIQLLPKFVQLQIQWDQYMAGENRRKASALARGLPYTPLPPNSYLNYLYHQTRNQLRDMGFLDPSYRLNKAALTDDTIKQIWTTAITPKTPAGPIVVPRGSIAKEQQGMEKLGLVPPPEPSGVNSDDTTTQASMKGFSDNAGAGDYQSTLPSDAVSGTGKTETDTKSVVGLEKPVDSVSKTTSERGTGYRKTEGVFDDQYSNGNTFSWSKEV